MAPDRVLGVLELVADAHAARGVDQEGEGHRRPLVPLERVEIDARLADPDDEIVLGQALDIFAFLVRDEDGQHDVLGACALGIRGSFGLLREGRRGDHDQQDGGCQQAFHRTIIRPKGP